MNDLTAGADTPAADGVQPEATVESPTSTPDQPTTDNVETDQAAPDTGDDEAAKPRKKPGVHNRIDELTRQKHEALREAEYWRNKAQEAAAKPLDDLDYDDQIIHKVKLSERQERAEAAQRNAEQVIARQFSELEQDARSKWADYDAVTRNPLVPISETMAGLILESEMGPEVAYHLGKNPAEARRLAGLSERELAREMGRIEARLQQPKAPPKQPPAPVDPVSGIRAGGSKDPAKMTMAEYVAWRNAGNG